MLIRFILKKQNNIYSIYTLKDSAKLRELYVGKLGVVKFSQLSSKFPKQQQF